MFEFRWVEYKGLPRPGAVHVMDALWQSLQYRTVVDGEEWSEWQDVPMAGESMCAADHQQGGANSWPQNGADGPAGGGPTQAFAGRAEHDLRWSDEHGGYIGPSGGAGGAGGGGPGNDFYIDDSSHKS